MTHRLLRLFTLFAILLLGAAGIASAQECSGTITAGEAIRAEMARYAAQTTNDFAAMDKLFGNDLTTTPRRRAMTRRRSSTPCARAARSTAR
jgi:hypothetical protein